MKDAEIAFSPGFRWGTSLLPGQPILMEHVLDQTAITYPWTTVTNMSGEMDQDRARRASATTCDPDPYYQQGGDMVRVGGLQWTCDPTAKMGQRIQNMMLKGQPIDPAKNYKVAGWAPVSEEAKNSGEPIWDVVAQYLRDIKDGQAGYTQSPDAEGRRQQSGDRMTMTTLFKNLLVAACIATAGGAWAADWAPGTTTWEQLPEIKRTRLGLYLTPQQAYDMKKANPKGVALFDVRTRAEAMYVGWPGDARRAGALHRASGTDDRMGRQAAHVQAGAEPGLRTRAGAPPEGYGARQGRHDHPDLPLRRPQFESCRPPAGRRLRQGV